MTHEIFSPTGNFEKGAPVGGVSSSDGISQILLRLDPTTKRLLVSTDATLVDAGDAIDTDTAGYLVFGRDPTSIAVALSLNTDGSIIPGGQLITKPFDYIGFTYSGSNPTVLVFRSGGSGGTIVHTLTLAYSGSNITSVTRT